MRVERAPDKLILRDAPGCLWLFGAFFIAVASVFVYGSVGGFTDYDQVPRYALVFSFVMGAIGIAVGVWQISAHPFSKVIIDKRFATVILTRVGLRGKNASVYNFFEIRDFFVTEGEDDEGGKLWRLALRLENGETVELSKVWERNESECRDTAQFANEYLPERKL